MRLETQIFPAVEDKENEIKITARIPKKDIAELFNNTCYLALQKIWDIHFFMEITDAERIERTTDILIQLEADYEDWGLSPLGMMLKYKKE